MVKLPFKPEIVIFDFDGTLVYHEHEFILNETERLIGEYNLPSLDRDTLRHYFALHDFTGFYTGDDREKFSEIFWNDFNHHLYPEPRLFDGIETTLSEIFKREIKCAVATARVDDQFDVKGHLGKLNVLQYFSYIGLRQSEIINWRDKTETILRVCRETGADVSRAIMIGDAPVDIESGKKVGVGFTVAVRSGGIYDDVLLRCQPDVLLDSAADLLNLLP